MTYYRITCEEELHPGYIKIPYLTDNVVQFSSLMCFFVFLLVYFTLFSPGIDLSIYKIYAERS